MSWLEPVECTAARDCLQRGHVFAAAAMLLAGRQGDHRAVSNLRLEVQARLVTIAADAFGRGEAAIAEQAIELARQCPPLPPEAMALGERISAACAEAQRHREWAAGRIAAARQAAAAGHVLTGLGQLAKLEGEAAAQRARVEIEERLTRFERYVADYCACLTRREWTAARQWLQQARRLMPDDARGCQLAEELRQLDPDGVPSAPSGPDGPPRAQERDEDALGTAGPLRRGHRGVLVGHLAAVLFSPEVTVGSRRDPAVDIPLLARVHRRHARIGRDKRGPDN